MRQTRTDGGSEGGEASTPVYVLAQVTVEDWQRYREEYLPPTIERIEAHGGRMLVGSDEAAVLEGAWDGNWTVVIEFPGEADARAFFDDDEYAEVRPVRLEAAESSDIVLVPGFSGLE